MKKQVKRTLLFYIVMAVVLSLPMNSFAQEKRGLFSSGDETSKQTQTGLMGGGGLRGTSNIGTNPGNQPFGVTPDSPLGSGVIMLIAAGAGYAVLKRKQEKN